MSVLCEALLRMTLNLNEIDVDESEKLHELLLFFLAPVPSFIYPTETSSENKVCSSSLNFFFLKPQIKFSRCEKEAEMSEKK